MSLACGRDHHRHRFGRIVLRERHLLRPRRPRLPRRHAHLIEPDPAHEEQRHRTPRHHPPPARRHQPRCSAPTINGNRRPERPGPSVASQEAEGRSTITAGHFIRACGARSSQRAGGCFLCGFDCVDASRAAASPHSRVKLLAILGISRPLSFATQPVRVPLKDFLFAPLVRRRRHVPCRRLRSDARTSRTNCIRQIGPRRIRMLGGQIRALRSDRTRQCRYCRHVDIDYPLSNTACFETCRTSGDSDTS